MVAGDRSTDVMDLIAKVLSFTDDQRETVGLRVGNKPTAGLVKSWFQNLVGTAQQTPPEEVEVLIPLCETLRHVCKFSCDVLVGRQFG
jgi:hypothetical protein